ncbi:MAG: type I restriction endonuclease subunit R [Cyanobacteria bacterium J06626_18]
MPTAVTEVVKSLNQAESLFGLRRSLAPDFFSEWQTHLPDLTSGEEASLNRIKASYLHNSADGPVSESTINLLLVSPLLCLSSLCDPPLRLRGEAPINITVEDAGQKLSGRIDALVMEGQFWVFLAASKQAKLSFSMAIPQALTYMMGSPNESISGRCATARSLMSRLCCC